MEKTWASRERPRVTAEWKSRFVGEDELKNWKEGKRKVAIASLTLEFFHLLCASAAGVRRPAWGLHQIARPPPRL